MQYCTPTKHINPPNTNIKKPHTETYNFSFRENVKKKFPNKIVPKLPVKIFRIIQAIPEISFDS